MLHYAAVFTPCIFLVLSTFISRRLLEPIILSVVLAFMMRYGYAFPKYFMEGIYHTLQEETIAFLIVMLLLFGGLIEIMTRSNGTAHMTKSLSKFIKTKRSSLFFTWLLGLCLFMDDYLNSLVVGTTMKNITDKFRIPREQISIISITTSVPLCILAPISTWAVFIFGVLETTSLDTNLGQIHTYTKIVPFAIYPLICIIGTLLMTMGFIPKVMYLKKAYKKKENDTKLSQYTPAAGSGNVLNFLIPIVSLVSITVVTFQIAYGLVSATVLLIIWLKLTGQMNSRKSIDIIVNGMSRMTEPLIFIIFAFTFGSILKELGFAEILLNLLSPYLSGGLLPLFCFLFVGLLVFFGIDVWAVIPLVIPLLMQLSSTYSVNPYLVIGAVLSGISFGTQLCFISESNILVSETLGTKPVEQISALLPYASTYAILTSFIYLFLGHNY